MSEQDITRYIKAVQHCRDERAAGELCNQYFERMLQVARMNPNAPRQLKRRCVDVIPKLKDPAMIGVLTSTDRHSTRKSYPNSSGKWRQQSISGIASPVSGIQIAISCYQ
jgi:hypothetical protein